VAVAQLSSDDNELRMTSCLCIVGNAKATLIGHIRKVTYQGTESGAKFLEVYALWDLEKFQTAEVNSYLTCIMHSHFV